MITIVITRSGTAALPDARVAARRWLDNVITRSGTGALPEIDMAKQDVAMWSAALAMASDGVLSAHEQKLFAEMFGDDTLEKLKGFLSDVPRARVSEALESRLTAARGRLSELPPTSHDAEFALIAKRLRGVNLRP